MSQDFHTDLNSWDTLVFYGEREKMQSKQMLGIVIVSMFTVLVFLAVIPTPAFASDAWADPTCAYRIKITFKNSGSSTSLSNFPVLIVLNSSKIDYSKTSATDIRFYDGSTLLNKDTELWNSGGNSYIWVKVPTIPNSNAGYIYAYYGSSGASNPDSATNVWPTDQYAMVLHLNQSGTRKDATSNHNDGTAATSVKHITSGQIGSCDSFDGTTNSYVSVANANSLNFGTNSFSYSFWFYSNLTGTQDILDKKGGTATATTAGYKMVISSVPATGLSAAIGDGSTYKRLDTGTEWTRGKSLGDVYGRCGSFSQPPENDLLRQWNCTR